MKYDLKQLIQAPQFASGRLTDGNAVVVDVRSMPGAGAWGSPPLIAHVLPMDGTGDGITVSVSNDGGNTFSVWPLGECREPAAELLVAAATHLKFQRTSGGGSQSRWGIIAAPGSLVGNGPWLSQIGNTSN